MEKEKDVVKDKESSSPKQRPSIAQMPHPASFSTLYQLHQMQNGMLNGTVKHGAYLRHHSQPEPYMWHAKSFDNGIGKISIFFAFFLFLISFLSQMLNLNRHIQFMDAYLHHLENMFRLCHEWDMLVIGNNFKNFLFPQILFQSHLMREKETDMIE